MITDSSNDATRKHLIKNIFPATPLAHRHYPTVLDSLHLGGHHNHTLRKTRQRATEFGIQTQVHTKQHRDG